MSDMTGTQMVTLVLILVIVGILFALNFVAQATLWGTWLGRMRNNSGNYNVGRIVATLVAAGIVFAVVSYLLKSKTPSRPSQTRQ